MAGLFDIPNIEEEGFASLLVPKKTLEEKTEVVKPKKKKKSLLDKVSDFTKRGGGLDRAVKGAGDAVVDTFTGLDEQGTNARGDKWANLATGGSTSDDFAGTSDTKAVTNFVKDNVTATKKGLGLMADNLVENISKIPTPEVKGGGRWTDLAKGDINSDAFTGVPEAKVAVESYKENVAPTVKNISTNLGQGWDMIAGNPEASPEEREAGIAAVDAEATKIKEDPEATEEITTAASDKSAWDEAMEYLGVGADMAGQVWDFVAGNTADGVKAINDRVDILTFLAAGAAAGYGNNNAALGALMGLSAGVDAANTRKVSKASGIEEQRRRNFDEDIKERETVVKEKGLLDEPVQLDSNDRAVIASYAEENSTDVSLANQAAAMLKESGTAINPNNLNLAIKQLVEKGLAKEPMLFGNKSLIN